MKLAFIINGNIKNHLKLVNAINGVFSGYKSRTYVSESAGQFNSLCKKALSSHCNHLVFVGGDGSLNEGVNGLLAYYKLGAGNQPEAYDWTAVQKIKIGVLPAGSANDFVKSLYPKIDLTILKALIDKGTTQRLDVGWVRFQHVNQQMSHRFFMNITDVGMGAEAVKIKEKLPRWLGAAISYFWAIIRTIALYKKRRIKAFNKSFFWEGKMINLVVAKGRYFGNGLGIAPNADLFDGKFSLVIIGNLGLIDYFKNLGTLRSCRKLSHPEVSYHRCKEITITSADSQEIGIEMDGEYIGETPINLKCLQSKITFLS